MTEEQINAGNVRMAKIDGWTWSELKENWVHESILGESEPLEESPECDILRGDASGDFIYHLDLNAIARVEQKVRDKYPDKELWRCIGDAADKVKMLTEWYSKCHMIVAVKAKTEPLARFEALLKLLDVVEAK